MEVHFGILQIGEKLNHVEQIEANVEFPPCPRSMNRLTSFFLLGVIALNEELTFLEKPSHAVKFFIGKNLHPAKRQKKFFTIEAHALRISIFCRHDTLIIRELSFNQLGNEFHITEFEADLRITQIDHNR